MVTSNTIPSLAQEQSSYMDMATTPSPSQKMEVRYDDFSTTALGLSDGRAVTSGHGRHRFDSLLEESTDACHLHPCIFRREGCAMWP